jgi:hypothetical protein
MLNFARPFLALDLDLDDDWRAARRADGGFPAWAARLTAAASTSSQAH